MSTLRILLSAVAVLGSAGPVFAQDTLPELPAEPSRLQTGMPDQTISVALDFAALTNVPAGARTLVIGNPAIADANIQQTGVMVVTGKSYGTTNLVALDNGGNRITEFLIHVTAPKANTLTVLRGVNRETWSCAPRCEQTVTLGDNPEYFRGSSDQIGNRNTLATQR